MFKDVADILKAAFWPFVALVALFMFYGPLHSVLLSVARRADQIQTIKLGSIELNIKVGQLPKASKEVAEVLPKLDEEMIRRLFFVPSNSPYFGDCVDPKFSSSLASHAALEKLAALKQVTLAKQLPDATSCKGDYFSGQLTDAGIETRKFLFALISTQIQGSSQSD